MKEDKVLVKIILTQHFNGEESVITPEVVEQVEGAEPQEQTSPEVTVDCSLDVSIDGPSAIIHQALVKAFVDHQDLRELFRKALTEAMLEVMFGDNGINGLLEALEGKGGEEPCTDECCTESAPEASEE